MKSPISKCIPTIFFCLISVVSGWVGVLINNKIGNTGTQNLGTLIWILLPFITATALRLTQKNKFSKPVTTFSYLHSFGIAILFYPIIVAITFIFGIFSGSYILQNPNFDSSIFVAIIISSFIKNIFEEFAWRGYLVPKLDQLNINRNLNHLITGFVWAAWHVPFVLQLNTFTKLTLLQYLPQFLVSVVFVSWIYGELRLRSGNVLSSLILHSSINIITATLITFGIINLGTNPNEVWFSPFDGIIYSGLVVLICFLIKRKIFDNSKLKNDTKDIYV
jgi:membrane protease YdiL (CAAX protease family)